ncbi:MAG: diaminopimelate epimerase [Candidatus Omnitrophica bacterium]|nr:diaminopimelate epimerase [Candidatus Omnitrophota bacterium]
MEKIEFVKAVASGNDFVIINGQKNPKLKRYQLLAKNICRRKFGVGADGLLILEKSKIADIKMLIFNPDGSEAQMCGNGIRCVALYLKSYLKIFKPQIKIETKSGIIESEINKDNVKVKITQLKDLRLDIPIKINNRLLKVNFINTGVPHAVIFVEGLEKIDIVSLGRLIRNHKKFMPEGTNVDFVEVIDRDKIKVRTYERGVEDETFSCGTGVVASALITDRRLENNDFFKKIDVYTRSAEVLKVYFRKQNDNFKDVWLEGKARIVYKGVYYV